MLAAAVSLPRPTHAQRTINISATLIRGEANPDAEVMVTGLFNNERYVRALRSGFPLYLAVTFELREEKQNWFDRVVGNVSADFVIVHDPMRDRFSVEGRSEVIEVPNVRELRRRLETTYQGGYPPDRPGVYYYRVTVTARTLSDEDVDEVYRWLGGTQDSAKANSRGFITRTARRVLVQVAPLPREERATNTSTFVWR